MDCRLEKSDKAMLYEDLPKIKIKRKEEILA